MSTAGLPASEPAESGHIPSQESGQPRATDRGLAILGLIGMQPAGTTLADAARAVGLPASTALRHLRSLESAGFTSRGEDGRYRPGPRLYDIAHLLTQASLPQHAQPYLEALANKIGESAYLAEAVDDDWAHYTATAASSHALRHSGWLGARIPRAGTAVGRALAGQVDDDGTCVVFDAVEPGVTAVSVPVWSQGQPRAALCVIGPSFRLTADLLATARQELRENAIRFSAHHFPKERP